MQIGIYEQIINQLFEEKIASIDREQFYIGERAIERHEVAKLLAMYMTGIFEQMLSGASDLEDEDVDDVEEQKKDGVRKGVNLANAIIKKLIDEFHIESGNLLSAQAKILTAVIDKTQSDYPDLAKRLEEIMPIKGLVTGLGAALSDIIYALITGLGMSFVLEFIEQPRTMYFLQLMKP